MSPRQRRPHGSGSIFQRASDGLWIARIDHGWDQAGARRRLQRAAKTKAEAARLLKELQRQVASGNVPEAGSGARVTVKSWADEWLPMHQREVRPNVYTTDAGNVRKWVVPTLGPRRLADLNPGDMRRLHVAVTSAGLSATTAGNVHRLFKKMLRDARRDGHAIPERVLEVKAPRPASSDREQITRDDALELMGAIGQRDDSSRWLFALLYGVRQAERLGLTWDAVDLGDDPGVTIEWQLASYAKDAIVPSWLRARHLTGNWYLVEPKTGSGTRWLPLLPVPAAALEAHRVLSEPNPWGLVWTENGKPIAKHRDLAAWKRIQADAGVAHPSGRAWHLHECRHTMISIMLDEGLDRSLVASIVGQSQIVESYVHVNRASKRKAMERYASTLGIEA